LVTDDIDMATEGRTKRRVASEESSESSSEFTVTGTVEAERSHMKVNTELEVL
jgi:hypothetical protein